jgi:competence protein ComEC
MPDSGAPGTSAEAKPGWLARTATPAYQPLVGVALAVAAGIVADCVRPLPAPGWWLLGGVAWSGWLLLWRRGHNMPAAWVLLGAAAAVGAVWHHEQWHLFPANHLGYFARTAPTPVCLQATACAASRYVPPRPRDPLQSVAPLEQTRLEIEATALRDDAAWRPVSGVVNLLVDGRVPQIRCGDRLLIFAKLVAPEPAHNPGEFDFAGYWRAERHLCQLHAHYAAGITSLGPSRVWSFRRMVDAARLYSTRMLDTYLGQRHVGLASAVLLGAREQLDPEQTEAYFETGTIHLLVVSGLSVGILAGVLWFFLRRARLPRLAAMFIVAGTILFYMFFKGVEPPVVRATILVLGACLAVAVGRPASAFNTLAAAALVVLAVNPSNLFNAGAQLSFLCVAGMAWLALRRGDAEEQRRQTLDRLLYESQGAVRRYAGWLLRQSWRLILLGCALWLLVLPLVMARFHVITPAGAVLNTVLWLPVELALVSGFGLLVCGWFPPLGALLGWLCGLSLASMQWAVDVARRLPHSCVWVPGPADWWLMGLYGALGLAAMVPRLRPPRRWCFALVGAWIAVGFAASNWHHPAEELDCTFLSVEHGLAVVVQLPSGRTLLYDAGQYGSHRGASQRISGFLWSEGITHLDAVVLSHADIDHYNALPDLLQRYSVGAVYVSPVMFREKNTAVNYLHDSIERARVPIGVIQAGDHFRDDAGCTIRVLHPPPGGLPTSDNTNSVVLAIEYAGRSVLLTGDLEKEGMDVLFAQPPCPCDVVLSPHHGSRRTRPQRMLAWATPQWMVISGGQVHSFEEAESTYSAAGCRAAFTSTMGAVRVRVTAAGVSVTGFRQRAQNDLPVDDEEGD